MGLAKNIMGAGFSAAQAAGDFVSSAATSLTAAGTTQSDALAITADANFIGTVSAGSGVRLYNGQIGDSQFVFNDTGAGGNSVTVYPPVGSKVNNLATNGGFLLQANTAVLCIKVTATRWFAILSA